MGCDEAATRGSDRAVKRWTRVSDTVGDLEARLGRLGRLGRRSRLQVTDTGSTVTQPTQPTSGSTAA